MYIYVNAVRKKLEGEILNNAHPVVFLLLVTVPKCLSTLYFSWVCSYSSLSHKRNAFRIERVTFCAISVPGPGSLHERVACGFPLFLQYTLPFETEALRWSSGCVYLFQPVSTAASFVLSPFSTIFTAYIIFLGWCFWIWFWPWPINVIVAWNITYETSHNFKVYPKRVITTPQ
jgi:hypothetical protein